MTLRDRWLGLCARLGLVGAEAEWERLSSGYERPVRAYHNIGHVGQCLAILDEWPEVGNRDLVELALWYHDVVYVPASASNEADSAAEAAAFMGDHPNARSVVALILATDHRSKLLVGDFAVICDVDLSVLGATGEAYGIYAAAIREEYAAVPDNAYRSGRKKVLQAFLDRASIYSTAWGIERFEVRARENMAAELGALQAAG